jgi:hypothetical protein
MDAMPLEIKKIRKSKGWNTQIKLGAPDYLQLRWTSFGD